jgi:tetratricopeptide (TPR) repeat protein
LTGDENLARVIPFPRRPAPRSDLASLTSRRITQAREQSGLSHETFADALQSLLKWAPPITAELVKMWETLASPPGQVIIACEILLAGSSSWTPGKIGARTDTIASNILLKTIFDRDDLSNLSLVFDDALEHASADDISRLSHIWLIAGTPQSVELHAGRRIGNELISTIEHRVIQLRRADDFMSGRRSNALVRRELEATMALLQESSLTEDQARRLLTAVGELAQLGAWVAADAGDQAGASRYVKGGVVAARAANDAALAGNIISTLSYQIANTGDPREAAILARTAYAGGQHRSTPAVKALLLERVAWADAKSGDTRSCERTLGMVDDVFSSAPSPDDPDWVYWLNYEEIAVMAGRCYTELQRPDRAEPLLREAIERYDHSLVRENSLYLSWLATDYIQLNEIARAAEIAQRVALLASTADSARTEARLKTLFDSLRPHKGVSEVDEFLDLYNSLVAG